MSMKPLSLEEKKGTINAVIFKEITLNPTITKKELYTNLLNSSEKGLVLTLLPNFELFEIFLTEMNFNIKD